LYGVRPVDPTTLVTVTASVLLVSLLGCYRPARTAAASIDPMTVLQRE
jgi:ABC-type lipoprotein release transport system permease subunit